MWYNGMIKWLLNSPLHAFVSRSMMVLTYTGRRSGKAYSLPVNYLREGNTLTTTSYRERTWWRNLRGGVPVTVRLQGEDRKGTAFAIEDEKDVSTHLMAYLEKGPQLARYYDVGLDEEGRPNAEDVAQAARARVVVRVELE